MSWIYIPVLLSIERRPNYQVCFKSYSRNDSEQRQSQRLLSDLLLHLRLQVLLDQCHPPLYVQPYDGEYESHHRKLL